MKSKLLSKSYQMLYMYVIKHPEEGKLFFVKKIVCLLH